MLVTWIHPTGTSLLYISVAGRVQSSWGSGGYWLLRKSQATAPASGVMLGGPGQRRDGSFQSLMGEFIIFWSRGRRS